MTRKSIEQLDAELTAATKAEAALRAKYDELEEEARFDQSKRQELMEMQYALGYAVLAEDQARAALNEALEEEEREMKAGQVPDTSQDFHA